MNVKFLNTALITTTLITSSLMANAGIISGDHTTDGGKTVALQGLEWLSLEHTAGLSRLDVEDGFTDRYGSEWAQGEWRYATRKETEALVTSLWGGSVSGWSTDNTDGAKWFIDNFGGLAFDTWVNNVRTDGKLNDSKWTNFDLSTWSFGNDGECNVNFGRSCSGAIQVAENSTEDLIGGAYLANEGPSGYFNEVLGGNFGMIDFNLAPPKNLTSDSNGHMLVRAINVPETSTIAIFSLGLIGLGLRRKNRL